MLQVYILPGMTVVYMSVSEAAVSAGVTRVTIYRWIRKGLTVEGKLLSLTAVIIGGQYRIEGPALNYFLDAREKDSPSSPG